MSVLGRVLHVLRVWTGLADVTESHLTPSHGWLLPTIADARRGRSDTEARRASLAARDPRE